ncbi:MAG: hypothetical protein H6833_10785 [Planctomycetes bacterium]|nr:hypothetical protein [Planctomycetota bacterium]
MTVDVEWITRELQSSLRLLAADGPEALACLPDGCLKADELALDYDNFLHAYLGNVGDVVSSAQRAALLRVDELLTAMSGSHRAHLWTDDAVRRDARWAAVRAAAREALGTLGWDTV